MWIDEIDIRNNPKVQKSVDDFIAILWREFLRNAQSNSILWWMDLGSGWYSDKKVLSAINDMYSLKKRLKKGKSVAEILLVADEENLIYTTQNYAFHLRSMQDMQCEAALIGAPHDMYRLKDLDEIDIEKYKVIIFMNTFKLNEAKWQKIKSRINPKATVIWNYAAGIIGDKFDIKNVEKITGFEIKEHMFGEFPYIEAVARDGIKCEMTYKERKAMPEDENIPSLSDMPSDSAIAVASRIRKDGGTSILSCVPPLSRNVIRRICENAGCHMYAPLNCTVYANDTVMGFFSADKSEKKVHLKEKADFYDAVNNVHYNGADRFEISGNYSVFLRDDIKGK